MPTKITIKPEILELLGLKPKDLDIYIALLRLGTAPLRRTAEESGYNRGTTYDALKRLMNAGLVNYVDATSHRYFTAEDPQKLRGLATRREVAIQEARKTLDELLPELRQVASESGYRPAVRYYEGENGIHQILEDVLLTFKKSDQKKLRIYSSSKLRGLIADAWPEFKAERVKNGISVRAISIGPGGETMGLDERKWLSKKEGAASYILIYGKKTAHISADENGKLFGVIINDQNTVSTQKLIFDRLWKELPQGLN